MKITYSDLVRIIKEDVSKLISEGEVVDFGQARGLPWEFGPEGYSARGKGLEAKMSHIGRETDRKDEEIVAVALSNRAEELIDYAYKVSPEYFDDEADDIVYRIRSGLYDMIDGDKGSIEDIVSRIDAGPYFDDDIMDIQEWQRGKFKELAANQSEKDIGEMDEEFEEYLSARESGKVSDLFPDGPIEEQSSKGMVGGPGGMEVPYGDEIYEEDTADSERDRVADLQTKYQSDVDDANEAVISGAGETEKREKEAADVAALSHADDGIDF